MSEINEIVGIIVGSGIGCLGLMIALYSYTISVSNRYNDLYENNFKLQIDYKNLLNDFYILKVNYNDLELKYNNTKNIHPNSSNIII